MSEFKNYQNSNIIKYDLKEDYIFIQKLIHPMGFIECVFLRLEIIKQPIIIIRTSH
ncbi:unnamed protein product [Paramecium octaurelia]|uniref:Uncharacterized protein n=1 Tax=Paramecium octaurelia TaxID=43137 RepID=A0A8S1XWR5_PAROT|nr:unnamed protein product [Paramecium octaurelia]